MTARPYTAGKTLAFSTGIRAREGLKEGRQVVDSRQLPAIYAGRWIIGLVPFRPVGSDWQSGWSAVPGGPSRLSIYRQHHRRWCRRLFRHIFFDWFGRQLIFRLYSTFAPTISTEYRSTFSVSTLAGRPQIGTAMNRYVKASGSFKRRSAKVVCKSVKKLFVQKVQKTKQKPAKAAQFQKPLIKSM